MICIGPLKHHRQPHRICIPPAETWETVPECKLITPHQQWHVTRGLESERPRRMYIYISLLAPSCRIKSIKNFAITMRSVLLSLIVGAIAYVLYTAAPQIQRAVKVLGVF